MNGKSPMISHAPPFFLRLSNDERKVFQQNHFHDNLSLVRCALSSDCLRGQKTFLDDREYQSFIETVSELKTKIPFLGEKTGHKSFLLRSPLAWMQCSWPKQSRQQIAKRLRAVFSGWVNAWNEIGGVRQLVRDQPRQVSFAGRQRLRQSLPRFGIRAIVNCLAGRSQAHPRSRSHSLVRSRSRHRV
jgi:hypothetical protein